MTDALEDGHFFLSHTPPQLLSGNSSRGVMSHVERNELSRPCGVFFCSTPRNTLGNENSSLIATNLYRLVAV